MLTRRFFYVSLGILALSIAYHLGSERAGAAWGPHPVTGELVGFVSTTLPIGYTASGEAWYIGPSGWARGSQWDLPVATSDVKFLEGGPNGPFYLITNSDETWSWEGGVGWSSLGSFPGSATGVQTPSIEETSSGKSRNLGALQAPRPNPFNPSTEIAFTLDTEGTVEVSVYSPSGQLVRRLVEDRLAAGSHAAYWDGRDDAGRSLASGTYVYQLRVDGRVVGSEKAVVLR